MSAPPSPKLERIQSGEKHVLLTDPSRFCEAQLENIGIAVAYRDDSGAAIPWLLVSKSAALRSLGIDGDGLYALKEFKKGEILGRYTGKILTPDDPPRDDTYCVLLGDEPQVCVDGNAEPDTPAEQKEKTRKLNVPERELFNEAWCRAKTYMHKMNDPRNTGAVENVQVLPDGYAVALYDIPKYTELLWSYGDSYWEDDAKK